MGCVQHGVREITAQLWQEWDRWDLSHSTSALLYRPHSLNGSTDSNTSPINIDPCFGCVNYWDLSPSRRNLIFSYFNLKEVRRPKWSTRSAAFAATNLNSARRRSDHKRTSLIPLHSFWGNKCSSGALFYYLSREDVDPITVKTSFCPSELNRWIVFLCT